MAYATQAIEEILVCRASSAHADEVRHQRAAFVRVYDLRRVGSIALQEHLILVIVKLLRARAFVFLDASSHPVIRVRRPGSSGHD